MVAGLPGMVDSSLMARSLVMLLVMRKTRPEVSLTKAPSPAVFISSWKAAVSSVTPSPTSPAPKVGEKRQRAIKQEDRQARSIENGYLTQKSGQSLVRGRARRARNPASDVKINGIEGSGASS